MITFTPLSGAAHSSSTAPLAYLLQVDDVRILLDCGSPDWAPEDPTLKPASEEQAFHWEEYCQALREFVSFHHLFYFLAQLCSKMRTDRRSSAAVAWGPRTLWSLRVRVFAMEP
jgi:hypothetical protein